MEDEPIIAFNLEDLLAEIGLEPVGIASDLEQALAAIKTLEPDLCVLDVNLRGAKSYPIADILKEQGVPYVFATGYGDREHPEAHRGVPTVTKPYSADQLKSAFSSLDR